MKYPSINYIEEARETTTYFQGYNHTLSCQEGAFFDTKNITTEFYPVLSPRMNRGINQSFTNLQGILDKENLVWVDDGVLYIDNVPKAVQLSNEGEKTIAKMGAFLVIMPDKVWYNVEDDTFGNMEVKNELNASVSFTLCGQDGSSITWHDSAYYDSNKPNDGDYMMSTTNGKTSLKVYSKTTGMWASVATTYMKIAATGIGVGLEKEDGLKISLDLTSVSWPYAENIFVMEDEDNSNIRYSNFVIHDRGDDYITVPALLNENKTLTIPITVERPVPKMSFITECQNRLWGCAEDGHEVYCCKLGDVKNWNCFAGIATDSWAATIGTDGKFTGAISYLGYPIFFKEDSLIRITISSQGAHQTKDVTCRGVQAGSEKSLVMVNELLYYKSGNCVCSYDGQFPTEISKPLGVDIYRNAKSGTINGRYYINMQDEKGFYHTFVYQADQGLWAKEDDMEVKAFCKHADELYFVGSDNVLYSVRGTNIYGGTETEGDFSWMVESGPIGFQTPDKKQISRVDVRLSLDLKTHVSFEVQYDSCGPWVSAWQLYGKGTKTFAIPMRPHRCDHFRYRLKGHGKAKIYSITKSYTEGSDL